MFLIGPDEEMNSRARCIAPEVKLEESKLGNHHPRNEAPTSERIAMKYIYGYTIIDDVTTRDLQKAPWFAASIPSAQWPRPPWS